MGISRNMYLDIRDINEIMNVYTTAWDKGLKTTYYLHMKPRHSAEQSTTTVNKAEALGKRGFAVLRDKPKMEETLVTASVVEEVAPIVSPLSVEDRSMNTVKVEAQPAAPALKVHLPEDPMDALLCEGCQ
jgi:ribonucleoside-diphosphate reductase alpha chain